MVVPWALVTSATGGCVSVAGGWGVSVSIAGAAVGGIGENTAAVNVNCDTTVLAAEVRTAATSGVGSAAVGEPPQAASSMMENSKIMDSLFFMGFLHLLGLFNNDVKINSWAKVISAVVLHPPIAFIFSSCGGSGQFDDEGLAMAWLGELIRCLNNYIIALYPTAGNIAQKSKGVAFIPCAGAGIFYFPGFGKICSSFDHGSVWQILTNKEPIITAECGAYLSRII
jgi:hypothetical protein